MREADGPYDQEFVKTMSPSKQELTTIAPRGSPVFNFHNQAGSKADAMPSAPQRTSQASPILTTQISDEGLNTKQFISFPGSPLVKQASGKRRPSKTSNSVNFSRNGIAIETSDSIIQKALNQEAQIISPISRLTTNIKPTMDTLRSEISVQKQISLMTAKSFRVPKSPQFSSNNKTVLTNKQ